MTKEKDGILRIGLCGKMRSGKDTVAWRLFNEHGFELPLAFGDVLKHYAHKIFPDVSRYPKPRELYQFMNVMREYDEDVWVKHLAATVRYHENREDTRGLVVTDARQENEIEWLRENGFTIVKIEANQDDRFKRVEDSGESVDLNEINHPTERYVDEIEADYTIPNYGTLDELRAQVDEMVAELSGEVIAKGER